MKTTLAAALAAFSIAGGGCAHAPPAGDANLRLRALLDATFDEVVAQSPESLTSLGMKRDYDRLDDYTEARVARVQAIFDRLEARLRRDHSPASLDARGRLDLRLAERWIGQNRLRSRWHTHDLMVNQTYSPVTSIPALLVNMHRVDSVEDARAYVARLRDVQRAFGEIAARARRQAEAGVFSPKFTYAKVAGDARAATTGAPFEPGKPDHALYADFRRKVAALKLAPADERALVDEAAAALLGPFRRGYQTMLAAIEELGAHARGDDGAWSLPRGAEYYADQLRFTTTTTLTPDEVHAIGLAEVARIRADMERVKRRVGFEGTLEQFFAHVLKAPRFQYPNSAEGRSAYLGDAEAAIARAMRASERFFHRLPKGRLEVKAVEPWREKTAGLAFYSRGAPDGSRPGIYFINLSDMTQILKPQVEAIAYHEGVPGHHLQIALALELDLPKFRRFGGYGAYSEGWGLYAEKLAAEMGFYADPHSEFGRQSLEMMRAARLVVDTGMHAKRWSRERAIEYFRANTLLSELDTRKEIERYLLWPGQATGYKVGEMRLLELRSRARKAMGERFDIRDFHAVVLEAGPMPLDVLGEQVDAFVAARLR